MTTPSVTLLSCNSTWQGIAWSTGDRRVQRCSMKEIFQASTSHSFAAMPLERIVIEGKADSSEILVLLSTLDPSFTGDVLYIYQSDRAFLSAQAEGCGRVLFSLSKADLDFYVDVNQLRRGAESSFRLSSADAGDTTVARMRVLVADKNPKTLRSLTSFLSGLGCETLIADSALDAIQIVEKSRPDVVLLDGESDHLNGVAVARFVKQAHAAYSPRTIVLSAADQKPDSGVDGYLTRPLAFDQMANAVFGM
ncbi:MAG: response regulator [Acidobacteriota bacterium]|nr:response regulator [Acidobacteriota bacterium]